MQSRFLTGLFIVLKISLTPLKPNLLGCTENPSHMHTSDVIRKRQCHIFNLLCSKRVKDAQCAPAAPAQLVKMAPIPVAARVFGRDESVGVFAGADAPSAPAAGQLQDAAPAAEQQQDAAPPSPRRPIVVRRGAGQRYPAKSISNRALQRTPVQDRTVQQTPAPAPRVLVEYDLMDRKLADMERVVWAQSARLAVSQPLAASEKREDDDAAGDHEMLDFFNDEHAGDNGMHLHHDDVDTDLHL